MLDVQAAKKAGYTDQEIQAYMASKTPAPQKQGVVESVASALVSPFINTGKNIGGAGYELYRAGKSAMGDQNAYVDQETGDVKQNPFLNERELAKVSQPLSLNKGSALRQQISDSASVGSWAVPFGKGAGIASKALKPGAAVGALQSIDPNVDVEELPEKMIAGAAKGAAGAGLLYGAGKALGKTKDALNKGGDNLQGAGKDLRQSVRQIRLPAEVGGAQKEKLVNKTLDQYGSTGTPQQQYEKLQPTMTKIEKKLRAELAKSPLKFDKVMVKKEILQTLDDQGFLVGAKAKKAAEQAVDDVMDDIVAKGGKELTSMQLFSVKQKLNSISKRVSDKMDRGLTVNPVDEVMMATRDALDDIIAKYHPDVKGLTLAQSYLFDSPKSLSSARTNAPVFRVAGTSMPAAITTRAKEAGGKIATETGDVVSKLANEIPRGGEPSGIAMNVAARTPSLLSGGSEGDSTIDSGDQNAYDGNYDQATYDESTSQLDASNNHADIIAQKTVNPYGASLEELAKLYNLALASGDKKAIAQLKAMYDLESSYQEDYGAGGKQRLPASNVASMAEMKAAINLMPELRKTYEESKGVFNPLLGKIRTANPYDTSAQQANATIFLVRQIIGKGLEGGVLRKEDEYKYERILPKLTDTPQIVEAKIALLEQVLQEKYNTYLTGYQNAGYDPFGGSGLTPSYEAPNSLLAPFTQ